MSQLTSDIQAGPIGLYNTSTTEYATLGSRAVTGDGREFRYARAGAVALVPGTLVQSAAEITNHQNLAPTADQAIGTKVLTVTLGATAVTANYYANGWMVVTTSTGAGYQYKISSHPAAGSGQTLQLTLEDPLVTTLASATSKVDLVANPYAAVVINPTTATSAPIGVAVTAAAASNYCWIQTKGAATVLADGAVVVGTNVAASNATAGAVEAATGVQALVGQAVTGIATTQYGVVNISL